MTKLEDTIKQLHDVELKIAGKELSISELKLKDAHSERAFRIEMVASQPKEPSEAKLSAEFNLSETHLRISAEMNMARHDLSLLQVERNYFQRMLDLDMPTKG